MLTKGDLGEIKQIVETVLQPLDLRLVRVEDKVDNLTNKVGTLEGKVDVLSDKVDNLTVRVETLEGSLEKLDVSVNAVYLLVEDNQQETEKRLKRLEKHSGIN